MLCAMFTEQLTGCLGSSCCNVSTDQSSVSQLSCDLFASSIAIAPVASSAGKYMIMSAMKSCLVFPLPGAYEKAREGREQPDYNVAR